MFLEHFLDSFLESPRHSLHLILLYTVVEGLVPALPTADFVTTTKPKRNIKAKVHKDCEKTNIIERRLIKNSKGLKVPNCNTELMVFLGKSTDPCRTVALFSVSFSGTCRIPKKLL
jgi:hypothetical protein